MPTTEERLNLALAGRYRVDRELGRGGMATVYLAQDLRHDRAVALKLFTPPGRGLSYEPGRFLREIRIAARLTHPQIVPVHDSGEADGLLYYVMPCVDGESLRERLSRDGQLPVDQALRFARSVAMALDYAYRQHVLHRDIKPENILLHEGEALVADFGVALALKEAWGKGEDDTAPGIAVGTPTYMSPEQAAADRDLDGRSDQYALACVLYEMLAGQPPFSDPSPRKVMSRHMIEPPPSVRIPRPDVPWAVDRALTRALSKNPDDRFPTSAAFADALVTPLSGLPEVADAAGRLRAFAVLPFVNGTAEAANEYLSDGMTDELINALANVAGLRVASRTSVFALKGRNEDIRSIGALLGVGVVLEGTVRKLGTRLRITAQLTDTADGRLLWSERFDREDRDVFAIQDEIAATIVRTLRARFLGELGDLVPRRYTENLQAYNLYLRGRFEWNKRSSEGMAQAIRYFEEAIAADKDYALAWSGLADAYALGVDYRAAPVTEGFERAKQHALRALALDDGLAEAHTSLGWVRFIHDWNWADAEHHFTRAIESNPRYATAHQWYGWLLASQGRMGDAIASGRTAVDLDPASVSVRRGLGWLYYYGRDSERAIKELRRTLAMNPVATETHYTLGLALMQAGRPGEAEAVLRDGLTLSPGDTAIMSALGRAYVLQGRRIEAEAILEEFGRLSASRYVSPTDVAKLCLGLGEWDRAFEAAERSLIERRGWLAYLRAEPLWEPVKKDPRYRDLLRRMQLPVADTVTTPVA